MLTGRGRRIRVCDGERARMGRRASMDVAGRVVGNGQVAMPASRVLHARLGHSARVSRLSDLAFRVWTTYVLGADDFGVMRADAVAFQAAHDALRERPAEEVAASIDRLVEVGLVSTFEHRGVRFLYQARWQDFQRVRFPGRTVYPLPAGAMVSARTFHLWSAHPGGSRLPAAKGPFAASAPLRKFFGSSSALLRNRDFRTTSEVVPHHFGTTSEVNLHQQIRADFGSEGVQSRTTSEAHARDRARGTDHGSLSTSVPHPVSWTQVWATRLGVARTPLVPRGACDKPASRGASTGCSARRIRRRRRARRRDFETPGRRRLAP